jgi:hypothetical protein
MRGKIECSDSVIKRVSNNLIKGRRARSKYDFYLNPDLLAIYLEKKQKKVAGIETEHMDFGISKAYRLLPHYDGKDEQTNQESI